MNFTDKNIVSVYIDGITVGKKINDDIKIVNKSVRKLIGKLFTFP